MFYRRASFWNVSCRFLDRKILVRQIAREADKAKLELNLWVHEKKVPNKNDPLQIKCLTSQKYTYLSYMDGALVKDDNHSTRRPPHPGGKTVPPPCKNAVDSLKCFVNMTREQRTSDKKFLTDKKELAFFILYVYFITYKPFYSTTRKHFIIGDCTRG